MNLSQALRLSRAPRLALVGAGGKTTALFQIARQLPPPALVSVTTHLALDQLARADSHHEVAHPQDFARIEAAPLSGVVLVTGPALGEGRVAGLKAPEMAALLALAEARRLPLLIEADGSRQRPLKAPAEHEPAIPDFADTAVVVAGLSGLGKPLTPEWVHRPERFAALAGLEAGQAISGEALARALLHPQGGLKNIPPGARRVALLNQADTPGLQAEARALAERLLPAYAAVIAASLEGQGGAAGEGAAFLGESARREGEPAPAVHAVYEAVAGVILAAGGSSRMGQAKQLLPWRGQPLVRQAASTALAAGLSPVIVVVGAEGERVAAAVEDLPVIVARNPDWQAGQSSSVRAGVSALPAETGAAIFLLADQPHLPVTLLRSLVELHTASLSPLVAPRAGGRRANPVLVDRQLFAELMALTGDSGGRALFARFPAAWLDWYDERILLDVDTSEDYRRLLEEAG